MAFFNHFFLFRVGSKPIGVRPDSQSNQHSRSILFCTYNRLLDQEGKQLFNARLDFANGKRRTVSARFRRVFRLLSDFTGEIIIVDSPKSVSTTDIGELLSNETAEGRAEDAAGHRVLPDSGRPQVYVIGMPSKKETEGTRSGEGRTIHRGATRRFERCHIPNDNERCFRVKTAATNLMIDNTD